ncbi:MAG: T9SS type A sorting domain-containing protein [Flavobacteriales bacterium]|nr:T9SS type A sorting domain-containing protein [Flavobacteriales bacterium]
MKNLIAFTLAVGSFVAGQGQYWCPPGAQWNNDYWTPSGEVGYLVTTYNGEVLFNDSLCQELSTVGHAYSYQSNTVSVWDAVISYTYSSTDVVYLWNGTNFDTLYNFSAQPGDRWRSGGDGFEPGIEFMVLDTGHMNLDGELLRSLSVEIGQEDLFFVSDTLLERVGTVQTFWNILQSQLFYIDGGYGRLRCYNDDDINITRVEGACEIALGVNDIEQDPTIHVWPNPGTDHCVVSGLSGSGPTRITLNDAFGRVLQTSNSTGTNVELNTSELRAGVYFVVVENGAGRQTENWIKQ